jgi:predicted nucleic acid-binding protein
VEVRALADVHSRRRSFLAERSQGGRKFPDLLVAAAAEELDFTVRHYDADFDHIADMTGQDCQGRTCGLHRLTAAY